MQTQLYEKIEFNVMFSFEMSENMHAITFKNGSSYPKLYDIFS